MEHMPLAEAVELFFDHRRSKNLSPETLRIYTHWLTVWQQWRWREQRGSHLADVTIDELRVFFRYLEYDYIPHRTNPRRPAVSTPGLSENSRAGVWRTVRSFWIFCEFEGWLTEPQTRFFANDRIPCPSVEEEIRPHCDAATLDELLDAAGDGNDEESARNRAILLLFAESGLRISELAGLTDEMMELEKRQAKVKGKGRKHDYVFWGTRTALALRRYLRLRRGKSGGALPLFRGVSSRNNGGAMTDNAIRGMVKRLGVDVPAGSPVHFLRHGFAHTLLDDNVDEFRLQQLMRHRSMVSTRRYTREHPGKLKDIHGDVFE